MVLAGVLGACVGSPAVRAQATPTPSLAGVGFLAGCWAQGGPSGDGLREVWPAPAENMMTGLSQFWRAGAVVDWEFHRIDATPAGPALTPHPRGVASVTFTPDSVSDTRIVWTNMAHDFPRRIVYERVPEDVLRIQVDDGVQGGRSLTWTLIRSDCP